LRHYKIPKDANIRNSRESSIRRYGRGNQYSYIFNRAGCRWWNNRIYSSTAKAEELHIRSAGKSRLQKFTEEALRESFTKAAKDHAGWKFVSSDNIDKADAAFLLEVTSMGVDNPPQWPPSMDMSYPPTITISATLIGNPPFEIVRTEGKVQALDPTNHPILYQRVELISNKDKLPRHFSRQYSDDPEVFKTSFQEAIDLAVKRIADSWATEKVSR